MNLNQRKFAIIFWLVFLMGIIVDSVIHGNKELEYYFKTKGKVVDQIMVWQQTSLTGGSYEPRPQIQYFVDNQEYFYVDHNIPLKTGREPTILYLKSNLHSARVYNFWFWIDMGHIIPAFLICYLVYRIVIIISSKYDDDPVILPSNHAL